MKEIIDFMAEELAKAAQIAAVGIGVGGAFVLYAIYFGG